MGKTIGPGNVPAENLMSYIEVTAEMLHVLFRKSWEEEHVPMEWKERHLFNIPKKEDLGKCENYKGITLLSILGKFSTVGF